VENENPYSLKQ